MEHIVQNETEDQDEDSWWNESLIVSNNKRNLYEKKRKKEKIVKERKEEERQRKRQLEYDAAQTGVQLNMRAIQITGCTRILVSQTGGLLFNFVQNSPSCCRLDSR